MAEEVSRPIWTLDARDNIYLEVVTEYFKMTNSQSRDLIQYTHRELLAILARKRVDYNALRAALTPSTKRLEYAFIFDSAKVDYWHYGIGIAEHVLPLLDKRTTCSILTGDLLGLDQSTRLQLVLNYARPDKRTQISGRVEPYCIYINNLTDRMAQSLIAGLDKYPPFIACIPATYSSPVKDYISSTVGWSYVKTGRTMICAHEDDVSNEEDVNNPDWPLSSHGYRAISIQETYANLFLSYKIERRVLAGLESDTEFALLSISESPIPLQGLRIDVSEAKLDYLRSAKEGNMKLAGLNSLTGSQLAELISSKISQNYIYNLRFLNEHEVSLFNIIIEIHVENRTVPVKMMAALEYRPHESLLRLVTLF